MLADRFPAWTCGCLTRTSSKCMPLTTFGNQDLGIKRQDHAQRIITHLTSIYAPELHSQLQLAAGDASSADQKGPQITLCVEGNISAGKSTFLGYITNNNEELQGTLGVRCLYLAAWWRRI